MAALSSWMIKSQSWLFGFLTSVGVCLALLLLNGWMSEFHPGNVWGIGYGIAASVLLLGALFYGVRRRAPRKGPGSLRNWLQLHVYGGSLFLLLVLMHSGFQLPSGVLAWGMWTLSIWTVASGILGVLIQKWIPRLLTEGLTTEVHYDRIGELVASISNRTKALVEVSEAPVQEFYEESLAEVMSLPRPRLIYFLDIRGGIQSQTRRFKYLRAFLSPDGQKRLDELESLFTTKLELDAHYTLQRALRWWLYSHIPFSLVLAVLLAFHVFSVLYY